MRLLHTSDWHLGRQIRGLSRQSEFEAVLGEVVDIATRENVDLVLVAGDIFESFSPPPEAERLLYAKLEELVQSGVQVVLLAGNHDHAGHMEALRGVLRLAGIHCFGTVTTDPPAARVLLPSRDRHEAANIVTLPWVPERFAFDFEALSADPAAPVQQYADRMELAIRQIWDQPSSKTVNVFAGHMLVSGAEIGPGGGERPIQIGQNFAVMSASLPADAQYIALGHVHKPQQIAGRPAYYAGSLLQLDFGEERQERRVNLVDLHPGLPADVRGIPLTSGRKLKNITIGLEDLPLHVDQHGDDYLKVTVELDRPVASLFQQVKEYLPNAVDVSAKLPELDSEEKVEDRRGLQPQELFARFYQRQRKTEVPPEMLELFAKLMREATETAAS